MIKKIKGRRGLVAIATVVTVNEDKIAGENTEKVLELVSNFNLRILF